MRRRLHLRLCLRIQCASWSVVPSLSHYQTHLCPCPVFIIIPIVSSAPSTCYDSASSTIPFITSLHLALERRRILARRANRHRKSNQQQQQRGGGQPPPPHFPHSNGDPHGNETHNDEMMEDAESGPRLMVLGPANAGKSTMIKNLVNLALGSGMGWAPAVVGLDPSNVCLVWLISSLARTNAFSHPSTDLPVIAFGIPAVATSVTREHLPLHPNTSTSLAPSIPFPRITTDNIGSDDSCFRCTHDGMVYRDFGTRRRRHGDEDEFPVVEEDCSVYAGRMGATKGKG